MLTPSERVVGTENRAAFFDREDVIAKAHALHELVELSAYEPSKEPHGYWNRITGALKSIPENLRDAALLVFANVVYLDKEVLSEASRELARRLSDLCRVNGWSVPRDVAFFGNDAVALRDDIFRFGRDYGWGGRLDDRVFRSFRDVSQLLLSLSAIPTSTDMDVDNIRDLMRRRLWVLLTDNALSGGSLTSDLRRLLEIRSSIVLDHSAEPPAIAVVAQIITEEALEHVRAALDGPRDSIEYSLYFDNGFKVSSPDCHFFADREAQQSVTALLRWFGSTFFPYSEQLGLALDHAPYACDDLRFRPTLELHRQHGASPEFLYGWKDCGYTIVTCFNAPTNSLPLLWYPMLDSQWESKPPLAYHPPFPRSHSRWTQVRMGDEDRLKSVRDSLPAIIARLRG